MSENAPRRTIAVIDGNSLLHRAFHALPPTMTAPDGRPTNAVFGFISMLVKMVTDLAPDGVVVAFDKGMPAFRREALEQYKVHRPPTADELRTQFPMIKDLLRSMSVPVVEAEGWEGDDILGTVACHAAELGVRALLVTGDRDALQLVTEDVHVVSTRKGITDIVVYDPEGVREKTGVMPGQIPDYLGLKGDTSDNIPGVPGIGEKTAAKLIAEHGSLDEVLARAAAGEIPGKVGENLREHAEAARVSRTVATIRCDVPILLDMPAVSWGQWEPDELARAFGELRFTSLLERVLATRAGGEGAGPRSSGGGGGGRTAAPRAGAGGDTAGVAAALGATEIDDGAAATGAGAARESWDRVEGEAARAWLAAALTEDATTPFGVAFDDGAGASLFGDRLEVAIARGGTVAVLEGVDGAAGFGSLLEGGVIAGADTKALVELFCPKDAEVFCGVTVNDVDASRLLDCGIAAYLLESARSSYELAALLADYAGVAPAPPAEGERAVSEAEAAAVLGPLLEERLRADGSEEAFRRIEMPLVPVLARMERVGVGIDTTVLAGLAAEAGERIAAIAAEIYGIAGTEFTIDSPKQLGEVLFDKLQLPRGKRTKTGWSTDASVLGALADAYPVAAKVLEYRELTKLKSTYIDALPRMLGPDRRLHTSFNQTVAATGRLSSSNPNLQNIPVRTEFGRRIRAAFVPAEAGDVIVSADYSQIELRVLAHLSEDPGLIEAFTSGADFHAATASRVFGVGVDEVTPEHRRRAKAINFGIVYGISAHGLAVKLEVPQAEAQATIDRYFAAYPGVREYLDRVVAEAHREGWAVTMFGRKRHIPELRSSNYNLRSFGERTAMNHPMQGSAADIMKLAMIEVDRRLREAELGGRMVLQVHDELVFESPECEAQALAALASETMADIVRMRVPLLVDARWGANWAAAK